MKRRRSKHAEEVQLDRQAWRESVPQKCMCCGCGNKWPGLQIHEPERKSHASRKWGARCNYLLLCERCHAGPFANMPHAQQLAFKMLRDPEHYDLEEWLRIRDPELRAPERVTQQEVDDYAGQIRLGLAP